MKKNRRFLEAKNRRFFAGFSVLLVAAIFSFSLAGCDNPSNPPRSDPALSGTIIVAASPGGTAATTATTGAPLYAVYSGTETVSYQWSKDGANVVTGGTGSNYTPTEAGEYTVTVSAAGYESKTSAAVVVSGGGDPDLSGNIVISATDGGTAATSATTGDTLYAVYSGSETVAYQWKKDGANISAGGTGINYTPTETGGYTVTVSATGYQSKTSAAVTVTGADATVAAITVVSPPTKTEYIEGEAFSSTGLIVSASYSDGSSGNVTGYALSWNDAVLAEDSTAITAGTGIKTVVIAYEGQTASFDISVTAQPPSGPYTVTFHPVGGSPAPEPQNVAANGRASQPLAMTKAIEGLYEGAVDVDNLDVVFDGWHTNPAYSGPAYDFSAPVTQNLDLYAKWTGTSSPIDISGQSGADVIAKALVWIAAQTLPDATNYTIVLAGGAYTLPGISSSSQANIKTENAVITLAGKGPAEISLSSKGVLFFISAGGLILDNNIALKGLPSNNMPLIQADGSSASLVMKAGAKISGNTGYSGNNDGGVRVAGGRFTMEGGEISGNYAYRGGGVYVDTGGSFTMSGGKISGNSDNSGGCGVYVNTDGSFTMSGGEISGNSGNSNGGGVYVNTDGSFTMSGGEISGNSGSSAAGRGGGVYVNGGSFIMSSGEISGNSSDDNGGGVYVYAGGTFTMSGGTISGNTASNGGGVYVTRNASFIMNGGKISSNSASLRGGGVYNDSSFTMSSGEISGNDTKEGDGGGVYIYVGGIFTMSEGTISGNTAIARTLQSTGGGGGVGVMGTFTMSGGAISGNTASASSSNHPAGGGGAYVRDSGIFTMSGGVISGNTAPIGGGVLISMSSFSKTGGGVIYGSDADGSLKNTAGSGDTNGHAVEYYRNVQYSWYHDTTLDTGDNISTGDMPTGSGQTVGNWTRK